MTKEKGKESTGSRTYLIDSIQLQDHNEVLND